MASWLLSNCGGGRQGGPSLPRPSSAGKLPSHLEFAPLPDDVQLPPPGSPFWCDTSRRSHAEQRGLRTNSELGRWRLP